MPEPDRSRRTAGLLLKIAGVLAVWLALGFGLPTIPAMFSIAAGRGIPSFMGFRTYGYGPLDAAGFATTVPLLAAFLAACLVHAVGGALLLWRLTAGVVVTLVGIALSAFFWWSFALPLAWAGGAAQIVLIALGWRGRRSRDPVSG